MIINNHGKLYRVYYDTKYYDFIVLTPNFGTTRFLKNLPFKEETLEKIEARILEVEKMVKSLAYHPEIKAITISA